MNVILNPDEVHAIVVLVTAQLLDHAELSEKGQETIRAWRDDRAVGSDELNAFTDGLNDTLAELSDEATRRRTLRSARFQRLTAKERAGA